MIFYKYLYEADYYMTTHDVEFSYKNWKDFTLFHSPYVKYLQEVRLNYNISDSQRENYENSMKLVTNNNDFSIFDVPSIYIHFT